MSRVFLTASLSLLLLAAISQSSPVSAGDNSKALKASEKLLRSKNPDKRSEIVGELCKMEGAAAMKLVLGALAKEYDGPAGFAMAESISTLDKQESIAALLKGVGSIGGKKGYKGIYGMYWIVYGLAKQQSEETTKKLQKFAAGISTKDFRLLAATIEALASAQRIEFAEILINTISQYQKSWEKNKTVLVESCIGAARNMFVGVKKELLLKAVGALISILEKSTDSRILWHVSMTLSEITGEPQTTDPKFWKFWLGTGGGQDEGDGETDPAPLKQPTFFGAKAIGDRVLYVIDRSSSMKKEIDQDSIKPKEGEPGGPTTGPDEDGKDDQEEGPDYSKVKTKFDLLKVELIYSLQNLPDGIYINIVVYSKNHQYLIPSISGFVKTSDKVRGKFIKAVKAMKLSADTNIHGAFNRAFCTNAEDSLDPTKVVTGEADPGTDKDCIKSGATTIFFLTDGLPYGSDDPLDVKENGKRIKKGRMAKPENIIMCVKRHNLFRKVVIHAIGIKVNGKGSSFLKELSSMTGGTYIERGTSN